MNGYNLPQKWNLYNFTGLPDFDNWDEGAQANAIYNQRKEKLDSGKNVLENIQDMSYFRYSSILLWCKEYKTFLLYLWFPFMLYITSIYRRWKT